MSPALPPLRPPVFSAPRRGRRGFSLLEVLLALALTTMLMLYMNMFIFSMGELWGRNAEERLFERHVRAVTRFATNTLRQVAGQTEATKEEEESKDSEGEKKPSAALEMREVRLPGGSREPLVVFLLRESPPIIVWPDRPLPEVECAFGASRREGLQLYWHSRLEVDATDEPMRATQISPWLTKISYEYYDAKLERWTIEDRPQRTSEGKYLLPQRLHFTFKHGGREITTVIPVPARLGGGPALF